MDRGGIHWISLMCIQHCIHLQAIANLAQIAYLVVTIMGL